MKRLVALLMTACLVGTMLVGCGTKEEAAPEAAPAAAPVPAPAAKPAPGTAGELKLYNVEERDAAMVMAIVADKLGKPLNELRFISIREVTE